MTEPVHQGRLGPLAAAKLRAIAAQMARLEEERTLYLMLIAEAQGYPVAGEVAFRWDLGAEPTWRAEPG